MATEVDHQEIINTVLPEFPRRLDTNIIYDFRQLTQKLLPDKREKAERELHIFPVQGIRTILKELVRTPAGYMNVVGDVYRRELDKNPHLGKIWDVWRKRMEERGIDIFGAEWIKFLGEQEKS